jgi:Zn-dependent peptidase ImmA (M78 family)
MINSFKIWLETFDSKQKEDLKKTISRLPHAHQDLIKDFKFYFEKGNDLKNDKGHVGVVSTHPEKIIRVAAPWRYGREFTILHEIGHLVWAKYIENTDLEQKWKDLARYEYEEDFCMAYACHFSHHKVATYLKPGWMDFITKISHETK